MEFGYIVLRMKNGTIIIYGGYDLHIDAEGDRIVIRNPLVKIKLEPPVTKEEISELIVEITEKLGNDAAEKLANILKNIPEISSSN